MPVYAEKTPFCELCDLVLKILVLFMMLCKKKRLTVLAKRFKCFDFRVVLQLACYEICQVSGADAVAPLIVIPGNYFDKVALAAQH